MVDTGGYFRIGTGHQTHDTTYMVLRDHYRGGYLSIVFTPGDHALADTGDTARISIQGISLHGGSRIVYTVYDTSVFQITGHTAASGVKLVVGPVGGIACIVTHDFSKHCQVADTSAVDDAKQTRIAFFRHILIDLHIHVHNFLSVSVKGSLVRMLLAVSDDHPFVGGIILIQINIIFQSRVDLTISAVDLICKPGKLRTVMDQISTVFIRLRYFPAASVPGIGYSRRPDFRLKQGHRSNGHRRDHDTCHQARSYSLHF